VKGSIRKRGTSSWELKFDLGRDHETGRRKVQYVSFKGTKRGAQLKLASLIAAVGSGDFVEPSKVTVAAYVEQRIAAWAAAGRISQLTTEIYRRLLKDYIRPHLGATPIQKLTPADIEAWHHVLRAKISARTVGAAHRVLSHACKDGVRHGLLSKNPVALESPPKVTASEVQVVPRERIGELVEKLRGRDLYAPAIVALFAGLRRGELLALTWVDIDLDRGAIRVTKALEETSAGIRIKKPKSAAGERSVSLPQIVSDALREHRRHQLEFRMALGAGRMPDDALVFPTFDGKPQSPRNFSKRWAWFAASIGHADLTFHALRHTHASSLLAAGLDVVTVAKRLGHRPDVCLRVYAHTIEQTDRAAAAAIDAALAGL
jgi:integrase